MARVLKRPSGKDKWTYVFTCKACEAKVEAEEEDLVVINTAKAYAGESWDPEVIIKCPDCHTSEYVTNKIPSEMASKHMKNAQGR